MEPKILYEDANLLVINKPSGMVVNRAESVVVETVQDWVESYLRVGPAAPSSRPMSSPFDELRTAGTRRDSLRSRHPHDDFTGRTGIVHRLDKETSGVLLIAKTPEAFAELQRQFKAREVEKTYLALVHGKVVPGEGTISAPVGRLPWNRERFGVFPGGREARTKYKVLRITSYELGKNKEELSLVEFYPKTGRTHQIRVHAKSIGHPIISDTFYAGRKTSRQDRRWCPRLFLHASSITFTHPDMGERMKVEAPLPQDLEDALESLGS